MTDIVFKRGHTSATQARSFQLPRGELDFMVEGFYIMLKLNNFLQVGYKMKVFFLLFKSQKVHLMHTNGRGLGFVFLLYRRKRGVLFAL